MKKMIIFGLLIMALLALIVYAAPVYIHAAYPEDKAYMIIGSNCTYGGPEAIHNITFLINATTIPDNNITNASFWHNLSGTFTKNATNITDGSQGDQLNYTFTPGDIGFNTSDGMEFVWNVRICDNLSWFNDTSPTQSDDNCTWTGNRSAYIEQSPCILSANTTEATAGYYNETGINISVNITDFRNTTDSSTSESDYYICEMWTNRSGSNHTNGTWGTDHYFLVNDNTGYNYPYTFDDQVITKWGLTCFEGQSKDIYAVGTNQTLAVDTEILTVDITYPDSNYTTNATTFAINITVTGTTLDTCGIYVNSTAGYNTSTQAMLSGTEYNIFNFTTPTNGDGEYNITVDCNSSTGRAVNDSLNLFVDRILPGMTTHANWSILSCDSFGINFNTTESVSSSTVYYGKSDGNVYTSTNTDPSDDLDRHHNITFNQDTENYYVYNVTLTDFAGNVNSTIPFFNVTTPVGLCAGWSLYSIHSNTTLGDVEEETEVADYVYWYNASGQSWTYKTNGTSTNDLHRVDPGEAVWIYSTVDGSWYRNNVTNLAFLANESEHSYNYSMNITNGSNIMGLEGLWSFGNFSYFALTNETDYNGTSATLNNSYVFELNDTSVWNNTGKEWISHYRYSSWENNTEIGPNSNSSVDVVWIYSQDYDVVFDSSVGYMTIAHGGHSR